LALGFENHSKSVGGGTSYGTCCIDQRISPKFLSAAILDNINDSIQVARKRMLEFIVADEVIKIEIEKLI
jgi:hypothetical protein